MKERIREFLAAKFSEAILREDDFRSQQSFYIKPGYLMPICEALTDAPDLDIKYLADITCVDWLGHPVADTEGRFEVVYNLYSLTTHYRFFLKAMLGGEKPEIASLTPLWNGANWMEREVFDLFGITFVGHPDLTKILTPDDLEGHPLRKDFSLTYEVPVFTWNKDLPPEVIK
ncbi:MAG: NADH-quinone oxidoreductase subunit C [candidate division Zixibacteria bacterium]|nr:NADH-quinone oxidoreductase subunit C [candidate division Zixibacteria bacterium]